MVGNKNVFLLGMLFGVFSTAMLLLVLLTNLSGAIKLTIFIGISSLCFALQIYSLKGIEKPSFLKGWASNFHKVQYHRKSGIFFMGVLVVWTLFAVIYASFFEM